ncbi:MAG: WD40 repeat domain-containing protein [Crocosphaera sp.]|nr:WD40 repeat domain-containing protein [Crocosphaera sp.]MDJ0581335.1 WD40 repeat domain-containing protein [Crocosphaera sp.]
MLLSFGGVLLLLAAYPSYIFWRYGFSATNPLLLDRDSNEFIYKTFTGHSNPVSSIAYSPDGKYLAGGNDDGTINI